ncbi:hypothetical protein [uncultured Gimesia sp.]|uniref:alpha/beta hydrolase n=1 Tax=uncultured Gimesia sp. TaxID=1678688 RepID=UPI00262237AA|nr:hypothetical protein [uncultured Gimesia sp.]
MRMIALFLCVVAIGCSKPTDSHSVPLQGQAGSTVETYDDIPWGGLKVQLSGSSLENANQIVVLLHGYGATEADLAPLADYIGGDSRAFVFPAAPIEIDDGGLAWATTEQELETAHARLAALVRFASKSYPDAEIAVGGFSQGATLSSLLLSDGKLPVRHLILYSPALAIDDSSIKAGRGIRVLLTHGKRDEVLPFKDSERLHRMLESKGITTNWHPFDGGHTITNELLDETRNQLSPASE